MADPGFPVGGPWTSWGGGRGLPRRVHFKNLYVEMKESGPVGGRAPLDPPMVQIGEGQIVRATL